jgi:hypothetical protein
MKKTIPSILVLVFIFFSAVSAQDAVAPPKDAGRNRPAPEKPAQQEKKKKKKGPSEDKIRHAEEKSKGNAFSGKGEGGDKNRVEPVKQNGKKEGKKEEHKHGEGSHEGHGHDHH